MSVLDTLNGATSLVRRVRLCLDGALQAEYDELQAELPQASRRDDSLAMESVTAIATRMSEISEQMAASEVVFTFAALDWFRRMALPGEHPPREGNLADRSEGHNVDTYPGALIRAACASVQGADGEVVTDVPEATWAHLLGRAPGQIDPETGDELPSMKPALNFSQVNILYSAALQANDHSTTVPPSARSLLASQDSGESSTSPGPGASPRNGSKAGSRRGSRSTSTTKKAASPA